MSGQHVRITLEGVADGVPDGQVLRVRMGGSDGPLVLVSKAWPGITVEDVTPPRTWTDGDVVQSPTHVYSRDGGEWRGHSMSGLGPAGGPHSDGTTARDVASGFLTVLRYQAGE